ncbi:elongation factor G [Acetitomaculum ruminis DSM 5522]|uniref:Elongation factor G n=1 Tax=Acetitomaculum ruminis DSM 5522 TaxID=1120918 RepID=A0A1I0VUG8_9FIRM|nr:elongation factor G [Acetitomaculum ruminis]SFA79962.1 elongation factor G [Acetitomaculum ruminis DSM 5522]
MNVFTTDKIRNVVLLGNSGAGKTSLVESVAYLSGMISKAGTVEAGNTVSDYDKLEISNQFSINTSVIPIIWNDTKVNFLDTPGYSEFVGEVEEAVSVADAAIIVISGKNGVEIGTKKAWETCERFHLPRMFFVTGMDNDKASYREIVEELQDLYGKKIAPFHFPIRKDEEFIGYVNVIQQIGKQWKADGSVEHVPVPDYSTEYLEKYRELLMESVAETSDEFMDRYFGGEEFSENEIRQALRANVSSCDIVPVMMGSNLTHRGMYTMMYDILKYLPSPEDREISGINADTNEVYEANFDFSKPKSAYCFKTIVDPFVGKYSLIKVNSGVLKTDDVLYNKHKEIEEKIGKLYVLTGNKAEEVSELHAGDIGALSKLNNLATTDSLSTKKNPILYLRAPISKPYTAKRYKTLAKKDEDKVAQALARLCAEDLTVKLVNDTANSQSLIYGIGDRHIDIIIEKLKERYKVEVELSKPKIPFRETILGSSDVEYKYKKQTGGHGQYGHVKMRFSPDENQEISYNFTECVVGGAVPKNYFPAVDKGLAEAVLAGPLAGYPVMGIHAELYDGSYHAVDSSEVAFKTAAREAFKKGIMEAKPILLEPIESLRIEVPDSYTGAVISDLNKRRGRVLGMNPTDFQKTEVMAEVSLAELYGYDANLRSMTSGAGTFSYELARYEQVPPDVQAKEVERRAKHREEED